MMTDIVNRLRENPLNLPAGFVGIQYEAADEIERLRKNLEWLRASFRVNMLRAYPDMTHEEIDEKLNMGEFFYINNMGE